MIQKMVGGMASYEFKQRFCEDCNKNVRGTRKATNHILHLILTICTVGFWLIIWVLSAIKFGGWSCEQCAGTNLSKPRNAVEDTAGT